MFKRICKITFIAHGSTVFSLDGIIHDGIKSPKLNEYGEEEIERVCEYLKKRGVSYDRIYTSPAAYCTETAHIIAKLFHKKVDKIDLNGRAHGEWQGLSFSEIIDKDGISAYAKTPKNGESVKAFNKRVESVIEKLLKENKGNRIIVVTTPEVIQSIVATTLGIPSECQYKVLVKPASLTQVSYFEGWSSLIYSDYKPL